MTDREIMQQALDAMEFIPECGSMIGHVAEMKRVAAVAALRDRLAQPEQEPVAWYDKHGMVTHDPFEGVTPLYTAPRPWVGLTDEEIFTLQDFAYADDIEFVRHIEAKLKEKNT